MSPVGAGGGVERLSPPRNGPDWPTGDDGHGLSNLRLAGDGRLIADAAPGRKLFDIARFEIEAQAVLQAAVSVKGGLATVAKKI